MAKDTLDVVVSYYHMTRRAGINESEFHRRSLAWCLPLERVALILVDVWGEHYIASHVERTARITRNQIQPLVAAFRGVGALVVHAPSPDCARRYPQWGSYDAGEQPEKVPASAWPPEDFCRRRGDYASWARSVDPDDTEFQRILDDRHIQRDVEPVDGDVVIANGSELQRLLKDRGTLFLFYAGFAANMCVPFRDYGMRAMKDRGYEIVLVQDCTAAIEVSDTIDREELTRAACIDVALNIGYIVQSTALVSACSA